MKFGSKMFAVVLAALAPAAAVVTTSSVARAEAPAWALDDVHSSLGFSVTHLGVTKVHGTFNKLSGKIAYDGKDTSSVSLDMTIDTASVDTHMGKRDEHLKSPDFFDAAKFPTLSFKSKKATSAASGKFQIVGDLTVHGVTKEVTLDVDNLSAPIVSPMDKKTHLGAHAFTKVNRKDFGLGAGVPGMVVSEDVGINIDIELIQ
jgi:polyisoprenoid-binding protein YceI